MKQIVGREGRIHAAGLAGIEGGYELPAETDQNLYELSRAEVDKLGVAPIPQSLSDALDVMEQSELVHDALGEHIFEWFLRNKRAEWSSYKSHVSQWELERYLPTW